jgi:EmrB/QacA subfamily drug resistance transporter
MTEKSMKRWALTMTAAGSFMVILDAMVVVSALGTIRADLGVSIEALEWTLNAYNLSFAVLLVTGAALGDRFGRRRLFLGGLSLFVVASVGCALAPNAGWLIAARAIQGIGGAFVIPLAVALLSASVPPQERGKALGIFASIGGLALILGPVLGGAIAQGWAWQWIFWINVPVGLIVIPLARWRLVESRGPAAPIDLLGVLLVTGSTLGLVWGLMRGNDAGWGSTEVMAMLTAGVLLAILFIAWEKRTAAPMVPIHWFAQRTFGAGIATGFLFNAAMYGVLFLMPQFFQSAQNHAAFDAGVRMLPWTATLFVVAPFAGALCNRIGERKLIVVGLLLQAVGFAWIAWLARPDVAYVSLILPQIIAGSGVSMATPATQNVILGAVARSDLGKASGIYNMFRFLGAVSGIAIAGAVFGIRGSFISPDSFTAGFVMAAYVTASLSLLGAVIGLRVRRSVNAS